LGYDSAESEQVIGNTETSEEMAGGGPVKLQNGILDNEAVLTRSKTRAWKKSRRSRSPQKIVASSSSSPRSSKSSPSPDNKTCTRRGTYQKFRRKQNGMNGDASHEMGNFKMIEKRIKKVRGRKFETENDCQNLDVLKDACNNRKLVVRLPVSAIDCVVNISSKTLNGYRLNGLTGNKIKRVRGPDKKVRKKKCSDTSEKSSPEHRIVKPKKVDSEQLASKKFKKSKIREVATKNLRKARKVRTKATSSSGSSRSCDSSSSESPKKRLNFLFSTLLLLV